MITTLVVSYVFHYTLDPEPLEAQAEDVCIDGHSVIEWQGRLDGNAMRRVIAELEANIATINHLDLQACRLVVTNVSIVSVDYGSEEPGQVELTL